MIRLLIGGSPCTHWSIAKNKGREVKPAGIGWELFNNYDIARRKFCPDFFLYENNWSASDEIKKQIQSTLGGKLTRINSSLLSAQKRDRFYVCNFDVDVPEDRGILLKDILEIGVPLSDGEIEYMIRVDKNNKNHFYQHNYWHDGGKEKSMCITANTCKGVPYNVICQPIRIGDIPNGKGEITYAQARRIYSIDGKSVNLIANGGGQGAKIGLYAVPYFGNGESSYYIARGEKYNIYNVKNKMFDYLGYKCPINLPDGYYIIRKLTTTECARLQTMPDNYAEIGAVENNEENRRKYRAKLSSGKAWIKRDTNQICYNVATTNQLKGYGNGWTAEVIIHILSMVLSNVPRDEKIIVCSMYDGIGTGRYCLDKMGFTNIEYHAFEIDESVKAISSYNYPDIIHHGDAFQVRDTNWSLSS